MNKVLYPLALAGALTAASALHAITHTYNAGVLHETDAFASFSTAGEEMAGMGVHVVYADGTTHDATWEKISTGFGGVNTSGVYVSAGQTGTTGYAWALYNPTALSISSVSFDGQPGSTVFDVSFPFGQFLGFNFVGTPGTSGGRELDLRSLYAIWGGLNVTYSDAVALTGEEAVGDVFRRMTITFDPNRPFGAGGYLEFAQDTDSLAFGSVLAPASVPEGGATLPLVCIGLLGVVAWSRGRVASA